jgi:long-chain acyl-CoA synthetase
VNLNTFLRAAAEKFGEKTAIKSGDQRLTYTELEKASNRAAHAFLRQGINRGDKVAFLLGNSLDFVTAFFGMVKIGAVVVPLDSKYKLTEIKALFSDCRPRLVLTESPCLEMIEPALNLFPSVEKVIDLSTEKHPGYQNFKDVMTTSPDISVKPEPAEDDLAVIAYTSGASLSPHGIMLTHGSITIEAEISGEGFAQTEKDVVPVFALPLHHAAGLTIVGLTSLFRGSTLVMMSGMSIPALLETIEKEKVTLFIGVPFIFSLMVSHAEEHGIKNDLSSLRLCAGGGSPLPVPLSRRFKELYGHHIAQFWGLTEVSAHITCQQVDGSGPAGSIGIPLRGCRVEIVDEKGNILPRDQTGEIICIGPLMKGYYNKPEATAEVVKNGWLYTGDIGHIDNQGNIFITGRKKDLIIPKGQNIAPSDIEEVISQSPKVAEVAVLGIPDDPRGEVIVAVIHLNPGQVAVESEIRRLCVENLANFKIPREYIFVDFPLKNKNGVIDKTALRTRLSLPPVFPQIPGYS